jgi:uncharacterized protein (UPF0218 family)/oligoribonuclease NrnB/cAMP/cGMP phosphodiesterase (DHH superfamily)
MLKDFGVHGEIREFLKKPIAKVISESEFVKKAPQNLITVGDVVSKTALDNNLKPEIIIFDNKVKRKPVDSELTKHLKKYCTLSFKCKNPAGVLSLDAWETIRNALSSKSPARIEVVGEEDLLTLAVLFLAPVGYFVAYGQPDKGIVLLEVTDKLKQKYILHILEHLGSVFVENLKGNTVIVHDSDTDGCTSAAIFTKKIRDCGLKAVPMVTHDAVIHENVQRQIGKLKPDNLIILDLGGEASKYIKTKSRHMKIMVVDHHHLRAGSDFGRALMLNPHVFNIPENLNPPTAYLSYIMCGVLDWASALGVVADKGYASCPEFLEKTARQYKVDFEVIQDYTNATDVMRDSAYIVTAVLNAKTPNDLKKDKKLVAYRDEFLGELNRVVKLHKTKAKFYDDAKLIVYDVETEYPLRGGIANQLQQLYKGWVIIVGQGQNDDYSMSMRTTSDSIDLVKALDMVLPKFKESAGGGHAHASGCKVLFKDRDRFIETFIKALSNFNI